MTVPASDYPAFLDAHARDIARGVPTFVVEYPTEPSRPYVDIDIETEPGATVCVHDVLVAIQRAFRSTLGDDARLTLLAMVAQPKPLANGRVKFGLHIVAPHSRATRAQLLAARSSAITELAARVPIANNWEDAYDQAVYTSSGLRLVGSNKFESCKCPTGCSVCGGRRRYDAGRPYVVHSVLSSNGLDDACMLAHLKLNTALLVKLGSIRCHDKLAAAPSIQARSILKRQRGQEGGRIGAVGRALSAIAGLLAPEYGACEVRDVRSMANGDRVLALDGVRYCLNVEAEHGSSTVYFYMSREGWISQRCHCPKYGCAQFRGQRLQASQELLSLCGLLSPLGLPIGFSM